MDYIIGLIDRLDWYFREKDQLKDLMNYQEEILVNGLVEDIQNFIKHNNLSDSSIRTLFRDTKCNYFESYRNL